MTIYDIIAKAEALRKETALGAISPERVGQIMTETLKYLNEAQIFADSLVHKIYANETAFLNDSERISDLTGRPMVAGQLLFIQNPGQFWRYDGDDRRTLIGDSIYKSDWLANEGEAGYVKNRTHYFRRSDLYTVPNTGRGAFAEVLHLNDYTKIYHASLNRIIDISYDGQEHIVSSDPYFAYKVVDGGYLYVSSDIVTSLAIVLSVTKLPEHYIPDTIARTDALDSLEEKVELVDENLQTQLDSHDVAIEDLQDNKVDKGDYAPALTAGFADNLVSKDVVVDSEFNLRRSGGGAISDGVARMEVVKGNSVVWNNLMTKENYQFYNSPTTVITETDGKLTVTAGRYSGITFLAPIISGHHYLISCDVETEVDILHSFYDADKNGYVGTKYNFTKTNTRLQRFVISDGSYHGWCFAQWSEGTNTFAIDNYKMRDLTLMFGAGNEPTTIEEFYARKPIVEDEYAYNEGEVIHCNVDAVKSVGRNLFNIQNIQVGGVNDVTGAVNNDADSYNTGYVNVLPNTAYYIRTDAISGRFGAWYDSDKQYISGIAGGGLKISPSNAAYLRMTIVWEGNGNPETFCINISDSDFNGQYEPYKEDVRELPSAIKEVFPNGMMSAGTAHDVAYNDLNKEVGVTEKRIGVVDLGTFGWYKNTNAQGNILWKAANLKAMGIAMNNNILCNQYVTRKNGEIYHDELIGINVHDEGSTAGICFLYDPQYDDYDVASFKAAMAGVLLYYELAEPIVTEHQEPFNLDYQVTNGGQEQAMATEPTSAFKAEIAYGFNASAKIKENANEIAQLKATIAQLQAALASMVNANVEDYE